MPPLTRRRVARARPPYELVARIAVLEPQARAHALDACGPEGWGTRAGGSGPGLSLLAAEPEVELRGGAEVFGELRRWLGPREAAPPLGSIAVGYLAYDLGRELERIAGEPASAPVAPIAPVYMGGFRAVYRWDASERRGEVVGVDPAAVARLHELVETAAHSSPAPLPCLGAARGAAPEAGFLDGVRTIREWIRAGDVYQVNLSRRLELGHLELAGLATLYGDLTARAGAPFSAWLDAGPVQVVSNSPERFLRIDGRRVETCPIKGTRPRGRTPGEDRWLAKELVHSPKDRAEHVMIVDLERNDLGRVCRTGSVRVARLADLRSFATVHHLVSSVQGELRDPADWHGLLSATFPGGSITGAPKLRAMEIIEQLEPVRRGIYTGAIGYFDAAGGADLSIVIRTAVAEHGQLHLQLGGGIVAESDPEAELQETRDKGNAFARFWQAP